MSARQAYQAYAAATQTVAKTKQIVLLYDAVIRYVQQAKTAIAERRIEDRYHLLVKAGEIIFGLQSCLDFENGKEVARVLYSFYSSIDSRLFALHRTNDIAACDELISDLKQMRDVWQEIDASSSSAEAVDAPATDQTVSAVPPADGENNISLSA